MNLLYLMNEAFVLSGVKPRCCCVFLYGSTGLKKTTYSAFQSQLYNRNEPLEPTPRLNSSIAAALKLINGKSDCVVVLADLFPTHTKEIYRQQEKTLLEITQIIGDGIEPSPMR